MLLGRRHAHLSFSHHFSCWLLLQAPLPHPASAAAQRRSTTRLAVCYATVRIQFCATLSLESPRPLAPSQISRVVMMFLLAILCLIACSGEQVPWPFVVKRLGEQLRRHHSAQRVSQPARVQARCLPTAALMSTCAVPKKQVPAPPTSTVVFESSTLRVQVRRHHHLRPHVSSHPSTNPPPSTVSYSPTRALSWTLPQQYTS
jgi:hypothetical protein